MTRDGEHRFGSYARDNGVVQTRLAIPGVELLSPMALVAAVGSSHHFRNSRHLAAWLGPHTKGRPLQVVHRPLSQERTLPTGGGNQSVTGR